ncbi:hypothetical protein BSKO_07064 [Bryopsis sp. KO-2023]|nr:hypothetical protein BSKO_07064 [Bryopsis sp. KO-2023]
MDSRRRTSTAQFHTMAKSIYVCDIGNARGVWDADESKCYFLALGRDGPEIAIAEGDGRATEVEDQSFENGALVQFVVLKKLFQSYQTGKRWLVELLRWSQAVDFLCDELCAGAEVERTFCTTQDLSKETWHFGRSKASRNQIGEVIYCAWDHGTVAVFCDAHCPPEAWYLSATEERWVYLHEGNSRLPEPVETHQPISQEEGLVQLTAWHEPPCEKPMKRDLDQKPVNKTMAEEVIRRVMDGQFRRFAAALHRARQANDTGFGGDRRGSPPLVMENAKELRQDNNRFLLEKKALAKKVVELDKRLEMALAESKQKDIERKALQEEVAMYRRQLASFTSGQNGLNLRAKEGDFPSAIETQQECKAVGEKLIQFFHKIGCSENHPMKVEFAECIRDLLKQMVGLVETRYKELLEGMLKALCNHESLSSLSRSTQEGFDLYCKRYFGMLFALDKAKLCILSDSGRNQGALSHSLRKDKVVLEGLCSIKENITRDYPQIMNRDLGGPEGFGVIFAMLWRASVLLYMQRPQMQFDVASDVVTRFSVEYHSSVDLLAKPGNEVVVLIPAILKLSKPPEGKKPKGMKTPPDIILVEKAITDLA